MNEDEGSYLRNYLQHKMIKQKEKEVNKENKKNEKLKVIRLKMNRFGCGFMEVTEPPSLTIRSADVTTKAQHEDERHCRSHCAIVSIEKVSANPDASANDSFLCAEQACKKSSSLRNVKVAWPKICNKKHTSYRNIQKIVKVVKTKLPKTNLNVETISLSLYHDKLTRHPQLDTPSASISNTSKSLACSNANLLRDKTPMNSTRNKPKLRDCDREQSSPQRGKQCSPQRSRQCSPQRNVTKQTENQPQKVCNTETIQKNENVFKANTQLNSRDCYQADNDRAESAMATRENSRGFESGSSKKLNHSVKSTQNMELLKLLKKVDNNTSSAYAHVISSLHALKNTLEGSQENKVYHGAAEFSYVTDESRNKEFCSRNHSEINMIGVSSARPKKPQESNFLSQKSAKSEPTSREVSYFNSPVQKASEEKTKNNQEQRSKKILQSKTPDMFMLKSSCDRTPSKKLSHREPHSENPLETLHCSANDTGQNLKSQMQFLKSREIPAQLSHDETPVRGCKQKIDLTFDLPYKATLVKRETNVGERIHQDRKEKEKIFGAPRLVTLAPIKTSSRPNLSRLKRNSILEFFQGKMSAKQDLETINMQATDRKRKRNQKVKEKRTETNKNLKIIPVIKPATVLKPNSICDREKENNDVIIRPSQSILSSIQVPRTNQDAYSPLATPKIFRRRYDNGDVKTPSSIAKSTTYNINENSPLSKKIEDLRALRNSRNPCRQLPVYNIDEGSLPQFAENLENISQEKTYKKPLPAVLKLRKTVLAKRGKWFGQLEELNHQTKREETPKIEIDLKSLHCKQTQTDNLEASADGNPERARESMSPVSFPLIRTQTPLLPSVMQELGRNQQTVKWINSHGNVFEVTSENGKYGNISRYKDPTSVCQYMFSKKHQPTAYCGGYKNPYNRQKTLKSKLWQNLSETTSQPSPSQTHIKPFRANWCISSQRPDESVMVVYSNGRGNDISFRC